MFEIDLGIVTMTVVGIAVIAFFYLVLAFYSKTLPRSQNETTPIFSDVVTASTQSEAGAKTLPSTLGTYTIDKDTWTANATNNRMFPRYIPPSPSLDIRGTPNSGGATIPPESRVSKTTEHGYSYVDRDAAVDDVLPGLISMARPGNPPTLSYTKSTTRTAPLKGVRPVKNKKPTKRKTKKASK